jgi:hypothetical protein
MRRSVYTPTKEMLADTKFTTFLDELVRRAEANGHDITREEWLRIS